MELRRSFLHVLAAGSLALGAAAGGVSAQPAPFEPQVGQRGKDVIWVPTPQSLVDKMLGAAKVTPGDYVIDLGSGDGRTVISAAKLGAKAHGIEYNPDMVELSKRNAAKAGVSDRATFEKPAQYSEGIDYVLVNGVAVVASGKLVEGVAPGRGIRRN